MSYQMNHKIDELSGNCLIIGPGFFDQSALFPLPEESVYLNKKIYIFSVHSFLNDHVPSRLEVKNETVSILPLPCPLSFQVRVIGKLHSHIHSGYLVEYSHNHQHLKDSITI